MSDTAHYGKGDASGIADQIRPGALFHGLIREFASGSAIHAYLFTGIAGVGKKTLARQCAMAALCVSESKPCFNCPPCIRFQNGTHPDVTVITGERSIGVDAVREAIRLSGEHTFEGGRRIVLIDQADKMTAQAQNSLLKTLEEPTEETTFILVAEEASSLLPTVVSRLRIKHIPPWTREEMMPILLDHGVPSARVNELIQFSGGSIGMALQMFMDPEYTQLHKKVMQSFFMVENPMDVFPISSAMREEKDQADGYLDMAESLVREVLFTRIGQVGSAILNEYPKMWQIAGEKAPIPSLQRVMDAIFLARRQRASQVSWQAVLEELLLKITEEVKTWQQ